MIGDNRFVGGGNEPLFPGGDALKALFGGSLPPLVWDGLGGKDALIVGTKLSGLSLNLPKQGASPTEAKPEGLAFAPMAAVLPMPAPVGAPTALEARLKR